MGQLTRREEAKLKAAGQVGPWQLHAIRVIVKRNERQVRAQCRCRTVFSYAPSSAKKACHKSADV